jgi:hypothetical protein
MTARFSKLERAAFLTTVFILFRELAFLLSLSRLEFDAGLLATSSPHPGLGGGVMA